MGETPAEEIQQITAAVRDLTFTFVRSTVGGRRSLQITIIENPLTGSHSGPAAPSTSASSAAVASTASGDGVLDENPLHGPASGWAFAEDPPVVPPPGPGVGLDSADAVPEWLGPLPPEEPPSHVLGQASRLSSAGGLSGADRLRRAYAAGRSAAQVLRGDRRFPAAAAPLEVEKKFYAILRAQGLDRPAWTKSKRVLKATVGDPIGPDTLCFGVASTSECQAFLVGAGVRCEVLDLTQ